MLIHLIREARAEVPVLFVDSGYMPKATIEFGEQLAADWGLDLRVARSDLSTHDFEARCGGPQYEVDPDICCYERRVIPGHRALSEYGLWLTALRKSQSDTRSEVESSALVELDGGSWIHRVAPLINWDWFDVTAYADAHSLPRHPYYEKGYTSIGCAPCTQPTWGTADDRSGRWNGSKTECGLHGVAAVPVELHSLSASDR